jgi:hypothetical protein
MSEACEKCGADISHQGEYHTNCERVTDLMEACEAQRDTQRKIFGYLNSYAKGDHFSDWSRTEPQAVLAQVYADLAAEFAGLEIAIKKAKGQ